MKATHSFVRRAASSGVKQPEPEANHRLVLSSCVSRVAPWLCPCSVQLCCCLQLHRFALLLLLHLNNGRSSLVELYVVLNFELPHSVPRYEQFTVLTRTPSRTLCKSPVRPAARTVYKILQPAHTGSGVFFVFTGSVLKRSFPPF